MTSNPPSPDPARWEALQGQQLALALLADLGGSATTTEIITRGVAVLPGSNATKLANTIRSALSNLKRRGVILQPITPGPYTIAAEAHDAHSGLHALLTNPDFSSYRESLLEQIFVADIVQAAWRAGLPPVELSHAFVDFRGYDIVATCGPITRHIQLKALAGRAKSWPIHRDLASKPSGCCVLLLPSVVDDGARIHQRYRFFGADAGLAVALHGRPPARGRLVRDAQGAAVHAEKPNHVSVRIGEFTRPAGADALVRQLFIPSEA